MYPYVLGCAREPFSKTLDDSCWYGNAVNGEAIGIGVGARR